ncbi:MAG: sodium:proton antiporter [Phycisphaeraceae bacterium]
MELYMAIVVGVLFSAGTYMMLRPNLIRVVLGMGLLSNAVNLLMISCGGYSRNLKAPFAPAGSDVKTMMDPLPPDIILTAIVISFAVAALFLTICYRVYLDHGTDNPEQLPNHETADERREREEEDGTIQYEQEESPVPDVLAELSREDKNAPHEHVPHSAHTATGH